MTELDGMLAWVDEEGAWYGYDLRPTRTSVAWDHSIEVELIAENTHIVPGETGLARPVARPGRTLAHLLEDGWRQRRAYQPQ